MNVYHPNWLAILVQIRFIQIWNEWKFNANLFWKEPNRIEMIRKKFLLFKLFENLIKINHYNKN